MTISTARRSTILSAACLAALLGPAAASAAPSQKGLDVLSSRAAVDNAKLPAHARAGSGISGAFNAGALSAPALELALADGREITARLQRIVRDDKKGVQSWIGTFDDSPNSILVLSKVKGVVTGLVNYKDETLEIQPVAGGKHLLFAVDNDRLPQREEVDRVEQVADIATDGGYGLGGATAAAADGIVHDVLVVYTAASASRHGQASLESMIQSAVQSANQAYANSMVGITMNLVGTARVDFSEGSSMSATKSMLQSNAAVANLRNQLGADVVMLVSENSDYCGLASLMTSNSTSFASSAYGVVWSSCLSNQSLAHEVGHTQGLMHDRDSSGSWAGVFPYSYGYRRCVSDGTGFRDVMSYSCSGAPRVLVFSNPYVNWNGYPAGISYESSPTTSAENARTLINTAATVAAFRSGSSSTISPTAPAAPSGLVIKSTAYNSVTIGWADNSSNETGFKVERSGDGVNYSEIANLGADSRTFADGTVAARTPYYYRVRAYNSAGASGYSNTGSVTTPDVPPPPPPAPSSVVAVNNADGTALTSWTEQSSAAASFEVRREKWDSRKGTWGGSTIAATVPGSVYSIVDTTGAGTYRYFVRALNAGGASAATGSASVTVTAPTKGKGRNK